MIVCKICSAEHPPAVPFKDTLQGIDCAARVFLSHFTNTWQLACYYGSGLDMNLYDVLDSSLQVPTDPVCDECIHGWVKDNKIRFLREYDVNFSFTS